MKVSTQTLALLGLSGLSNVTAEVVQSGANCPMSSFVTCKLQNGEPCGSLADQPYESCGMKTLKYDFKYCNNGDENVIKINPKLFVPKINNEVQAENIVKLWPDVPMNTGCRTSATVFKTIDTCANASTAMSLKVEGRRQYPSGTTMEGDGNYCYSWAYLKTKIRANAPVDANIDDVPADISMSISCAYELEAGNGLFTESCNNIAEVMPPTGECMRNVQFKYTCTNKRAVNARLLALVDETNNDLIQDENSVLIEAGDDWEHTKIVEIDMCKEAGKKVATKATAVAASVPGGMAGTAKASYEVLLPSTKVEYQYVSPDEVTCMFKGVDCGERAAAACFSGEVDLTHTIKNVGDTCHNIAKVRTLFNTGGQSRILAIDGSYGCASRLSCPDDVFTFTEKRFIDFCDTNGDIPVRITVETDSDDDPTPASTNLQIDANTDEEPVVDAKPARQCNLPPSEMWFEYTHRNCDGSENDQFSVSVPKLRRRGLRHNSSYGSSSTKDKKSGKSNVVVTEESVIDVIDSYAGDPVYSCTQIKAFGKEDVKVRIIITSIDGQTMYWDGMDICTGTDIRIGTENGQTRIASDIMVRIYDGAENGTGNMIQQFTMHTGCTTKFITEGQTFGAFQLTGFRN